MKIGLIDVDGHNFPNIPLMKIAAFHKSRGDTVKRWLPENHYDIVYKSKVFTEEYSENIKTKHIKADKIVCGGTGYDLKVKLPVEIENTVPDFSLYKLKNLAYGFLTRGCPNKCGFCIVSEKEGCQSYKVSNLFDWWRGQQNVVFVDSNFLACSEHENLLKQCIDSKAKIDFVQGLDCRLLNKDNVNLLNKTKLNVIRFAWDLISDSQKVLQGLELYLKHGAIKNKRDRRVYVLTNYDTNKEADLYRLYKLRDMGYNPYLMIYNKKSASKELKKMQWWVNNKIAWWAVDKFENLQRSKLK